MPVSQERTRKEKRFRCEICVEMLENRIIIKIFAYGSCAIYNFRKIMYYFYLVKESI